MLFRSPIILKYFNKDHQSDFTDGFAPDYLVQDDYFHSLGDTREALLAKAISQITGVQQGVSRVKGLPVSGSAVNGMWLEKKQRGLIVEKYRHNK